MFRYFEKKQFEINDINFFTLKKFVIIRICRVIVFCECARFFVEINLTRDINRAFFLFENDNNV